jgi:hypothetical protein
MMSPWCQACGEPYLTERGHLCEKQLTIASEPAGHVGPSPEATIREAFLRFHYENPHVYVQLTELARQARAAGTKKIGIGMLFEVLRWRHTLSTAGDDFKLNNNYRSYYARMIMAKEPDLWGIFELRKLHGRGLEGDLP